MASKNSFTSWEWKSIRGNMFRWGVMCQAIARNTD